MKIFCLFVPAADWAAANQELFHSTRYTICNLTSGDRLQIRVKAVNAGGMSLPTVLEQPVVIREILGTVLSSLYTFHAEAKLVQRYVSTRKHTSQYVLS